MMKLSVKYWFHDKLCNATNDALRNIDGGMFAVPDATTSVRIAKDGMSADVMLTCQTEVALRSTLVQIGPFIDVLGTFANAGYPLATDNVPAALTMMLTPSETLLVEV